MRKFLLAGEWAANDQTIEVRNPYSGDAVEEAAKASWSDVDRALDAAAAAFEWTRKQSAAQRSQMLLHAADGIRRRHGELTDLIVAEGGKPQKSASVEVDRAVSTFTWAAEEAKRFSGEAMRLDAEQSMRGRYGLMRRFPIGCVLGITPFNFPLNLVAHKVAPALAVGNPVIIKPASQTPLSALVLGEILAEAGSGDAFSVLPMSNDDATRALQDDRVAKLSFTGSDTVGWKLKELVPRKKVTLELGGNAGVIVEPDTDLERAAERVAFGGFYQAGQSCISVQRVLVHEDVHDAFCDALVSRVEALITGDPAEDTTDVGPLIDTDALERVDTWVREALDAGARALCGAKREDPCYLPTVLADTTGAMKVNRLEIFGPVVTVRPYTTFADALGVVNDSPYGLQAGVFTRDVQKIFLAHRELDVGGVIQDDVPSFRADQMPYGGSKDSGHGREGLRSAMEEGTETRILVLSNLDL